MPDRDEKVDMADLKRKSVRGGATTLASQGMSVAVQLASTVILARLLSPEDYGIMAMVLAITAFAGLFRDMGLSVAAVQKKSLSRAQQSNLFWLNVLMGALLTVAVAFSSPLVASFYKKPELVAVTQVLSTTFLISSLATQAGAMLVRQMQFGRKAFATISGSVVTLAVAVIMAMQGYSYWSLVFGNVFGGVCTTLLLFILSPFRPSLPSRGSGVREMVKFGANVTAFNFVNYFHRNLDNILIGRVWGTESLGLYSRAYGLLLLPISSIRAPIIAVALPALSKLQGDPAAFRNYYLRTTSLLAFLSMPLTSFLFVCSRPIIELALGPDWMGVAPIFSVLAIASFIQPASGFVGSLLLSLGRGRRFLACGAFNAGFFAAAFLIGVQWGAIGVAVSYAIANYLVLYPWLRWSFLDTSVTFEGFLRACTFPALLSVSAAALSILILPQLPPAGAVLEILRAFGVFSVTAAVFLFGSSSGRSQIAMIVNLMRQLLPKAPKDERAVSL